MVRELLTKSRLPLQIGFVVLLAAIVVRVAYLRWDEVRALQVTLHPAWVGAGAALTTLFTFGLSLNWQWLVRQLSPAASRFSALALHQVFLTSFLTRYLPAGAIVNIGGKVELLRRQGSSRSVGLESVLYETVFLMGGGLFLAWVAFTAEPAPLLLVGWQSLYPILMTAVAAGWVLCFSVPDRLLLWGRALVKRATPEDPSERLTWGDRGVGFVLYTGVNLVQGMAMLCMVLAVYPGLPLDPGVMLHIVAAYPIARLVGQAAPFAPGGIGVREAAFAFLVIPWLPLEPILISASLMRLISVLVEIVAASLVVVLGRRVSNELPPNVGI
jgi:hypothetical protein